VRARAARALALYFCACLGARCASGPAASAPPPLAASPELAAARALAPDYVARVREAQRALEREQRPQVRVELARLVALSTSAARAEAERIALLRSADALEQRIARAVSERAALERALDALTRERALTQAAQSQRAEAVWALGALSHGATGPGDRDRIWEVCARRAQALLAAASALGLTGAPLDDAELQLTAARTAKLPLRVHKARQALASAYAALGAARVQGARAEGASEAERRDLLARVLELGLGARVTAEALQIEADLRGPAQVAGRLALLAELLPAFPHGAVSVACGGVQRCQGPWLPGVRARLGTRLQLDAGRGVAPGVVRLSMAAYRSVSAEQ